MSARNSFMTLRDHLAAAAIPAVSELISDQMNDSINEMLSQSGNANLAEAIAVGCYRIADAMIKERAR